MSLTIESSHAPLALLDFRQQMFTNYDTLGPLSNATLAAARSLTSEESEPGVLLGSGRGKTGDDLEYAKAIVDATACEAMRESLSGAPIAGVIAISDRANDHAKGFRQGVLVGAYATGRPQDSIDVVVDAVENVAGAALNKKDVYSVALAAARITRFPREALYMDACFVGPAAADLRGKLEPFDKPEKVFQQVAGAYDIAVEDLRISILNRPRNEKYREAARKLGIACVYEPMNGDLIDALRTCLQRGNALSLNDEPDLHVQIGAGGTLETILAAAGVHLLGGAAVARVHDQFAGSNDSPLKTASLKTYSSTDLVGAKQLAFSMTAITDGHLGTPYTTLQLAGTNR